MTARGTTAIKLISMLLCMLMMFPAVFSLYGNASAESGCDISSCTISEIGDVYYTAGGAKPFPEIKNGSTILEVGRDFTVSYSDNKSVGTGYVTVTGKGGYTGSKEISFSIKQRNISDTEITVSDIFYNLDDRLPKVGVSADGRYFKEGTDYTLSFSKNSDGTTTVSVTGKGGLTGTVKKTFGTKNVPIASTSISYTKELTYTGAKLLPDLKISYQGRLLSENTDYTAVYKNNTEVGTATVTITGLGVYIGSAVLEYEIVPIKISDTDVSISYSKDYSSYDIVVICGGKTLVKDTHYTQTVNVSGNYAKVTVSGKGIYGGTVTKSFKVSQLTVLDMADITDIPDQTYTGEYIRPDFSVSYNGEELTYGSDYYLTYENNVNVGVTYITLVGLGGNAGCVREIPFRILPLDISSCKILCDNMSYTGQLLSPIPVITYGNYTLMQKSDFIIDGYKDNINPGNGTVTVSGTGNFCGSVSISFAIVKKELMQDKIQNRLDEMMAGEHDRQIYDYIHSYKLGNYYNTLITSPCTCHGFCETGYESGCTCLIGRSTVLGNNGIQCAGFTMEVFEYLFSGTNGAGENICTTYSRSSNSWTEEDIKEWMINTFRPGDYLAYDNVVYEYPHYVIIYSVDSDGLQVYEANYGGRCKINFRKMTYSEIYTQLDGLYHRTPVNYELSE